MSITIIVWKIHLNSRQTSTLWSKISKRRIFTCLSKVNWLLNFICSPLINLAIKWTYSDRRHPLVRVSIPILEGSLNEDIIVPCKPTSKKFEIQLIKDGNEVKLDNLLLQNETNFRWICIQLCSENNLNQHSHQPMDFAWNWKVHRMADNIRAMLNSIRRKDSIFISQSKWIVSSKIFHHS